MRAASGGSRPKRAGQTRKIALVGVPAVGAAIHIGRMIHRIDAPPAGDNWPGRARAKGRRCAGQLAPCDTAEANDYRRANAGQFGFQIITAIIDFTPVRIAIAPARVARIASNQVCDEGAVDSGARDHRTQQIARSIAAERYSGSIAAQTARSQTDEGDRGRHGSVARHHARTASHERVASSASAHRRAPSFQFD